MPRARKIESDLVIGIVTPVSRYQVASLGATDVVEYNPDDLTPKTLNERKRIALLIVGGDYRALRGVLPELRAGMPGLPVVALSHDLDRASQTFYRNHVDGLYTLPSDANRLTTIAASAVAEEPARWKVLAKEKIASSLLATVALLAAWWLVVAVLKPAPYLLPSPTSVALAFSSQPDRFLLHFGITAWEAFLGFVIGNVLGMLIAIALHRFVSLKKFTLPVLISFQAIPVVALAPLLIVWFGTGLTSKVAMAAIICFFPIVINALQAFDNIDQDYVELFQFYGSDFLAKLRMLLMPASFPAIVAALKISAGLSVVGAIVAELTGADRGIGYLLLNASYRLETDTLFVAILLSAILGILFFQMPSLLRFVVPKSWSVALR